MGYRSEIGRARERIARGSELAATACGLIEFAALGEGPPVLLVHGAGGGFDQVLEFAQALALRGFRSIAPSRFGYLRTPLPADASAPAQADAHAALLDALHVDRAAIVGVSAGAPSTIQFALRHPERCSAMVLLVPAARLADGEAEARTNVPAGTTRLALEMLLRSDFLLWAAMRLAPRLAIRSILATTPGTIERASAAERARALGILWNVLPVSARRAGLLNDAAVVSAPQSCALERIAAPSLVISVADDLFGTYEVARRIASRLAQARFVGYPDGGHVWVGHHAEVLAEITSFLEANRQPVPAQASR